MLDTGERDLPTVICLHSLFLDPRMFDELAAAGRGRFRFIRPEFPGQVSRVDAARSVVTLDDCADDLLSTIDGLGLERISLLGQSMGGDVAARVATRRPGLVGSMIFSGSSVRAEKPDLLEEHRTICDKVERDGFDPEMTETVVTIMFGATTRTSPDRKELVELWRERIGKLSPNLHWAVRGVVERESAVHLLPGLGMPTLVINGLEDPVRPDDWSDELVEHIPHAERLRVKDAGHSTILEAPELVIPRMLEFLTANH